LRNIQAIVSSAYSSRDGILHLADKIQEQRTARAGKKVLVTEMVAGLDQITLGATRQDIYAALALVYIREMEARAARNAPDAHGRGPWAVPAVPSEDMGKKALGLAGTEV
jgi:hypothetical protein